MSDTKFTLGPWRIEPAQSEGQIYEFCVRGTANEKQPFGAITASCYFQTERSISFDDIETAEANAHLIAAAPDMYEVLLSARQWLNGDKWRYDDDPVRRQCWQDQVDAIDAVIAKARGEKQ